DEYDRHRGIAMGRFPVCTLHRQPVVEGILHALALYRQVVVKVLDGGVVVPITEEYHDDEQDDAKRTTGVIVEIEHDRQQQRKAWDGQDQDRSGTKPRRQEKIYRREATQQRDREGNESQHNEIK